MESTIYKFIFRYSRKEQVFILLFTLLSLPFYYASLDIPKLIVNNVLADPESLAPGSADLRASIAERHPQRRLAKGQKDEVVGP